MIDILVILFILVYSWIVAGTEKSDKWRVFIFLLLAAFSIMGVVKLLQYILR